MGAGSPTTISPHALGDFHKDKRAFAQRLGEAFQEIGFVYLTDHGVPAKTIEDNFQACKSFFALPEAAKRKYYDPDPVHARGYAPAKDYRPGDLKEFWHFVRDLPPDNTQYRDVMPGNFKVSEVAELNTRGKALFDALDEVGGIVLSALAIFLGQDEDHFADKVNFGNSVLRTTYYPPVDGVGTVPPFRATAHEDVDLITLLVGSGEPGLEALTSDGKWITVETLPGVIVCNIGEMMQRYTNNRLRSTTHRVANPTGATKQKSRYCSPYFLHPNADMMLGPLATCITPERPNAYPQSISAYEYTHARHPGGRYVREPSDSSTKGLSDQTGT